MCPSSCDIMFTLCFTELKISLNIYKTAYATVKLSSFKLIKSQPQLDEHKQAKTKLFFAYQWQAIS